MNIRLAVLVSLLATLAPVAAAQVNSTLTGTSFAAPARSVTDRAFLTTATDDLWATAQKAGLAGSCEATEAILWQGVNLDQVINTFNAETSRLGYAVGQVSTLEGNDSLDIYFKAVRGNEMVFGDVASQQDLVLVAWCRLVPPGAGQGAPAPAEAGRGGVITLGLNLGTLSSSIEGVVTYSGLSVDHVSGQVRYPQTPPVGGPHAATWLNCGIYDRRVPNENAVHSLEHGAVWITYRPDLPIPDLERLRSLVRGHDYVLLSPFPGLDAPVVASAWGVQLKLSGASDARLERFVATYERGAQTPEPGAPCSGGIGSPLP